MSISNSNSRQVLTEVENQLSSKFSTRVKIFGNRTVSGGCISQASKIETNVGNFFLKWSAGSATDIFIREAESLQELKIAAKGNLLIPGIFATKKVDESPGFLVQEYLQPASFMATGDEKLGRGLALLHLYKNSKFGFHNNNYCGATLQNNSWKKSWVHFFRDNRLRFLLQLIDKKRPLPVAEQKIYDRLLERIPKLIPDSTEPVLIHGDLWSGNYMFSGNSPALIDPAAYYADREMEFAIVTMFGGFSQRFFDSYNETNPLPHSWRNRNQLYQLYHILNHYYLFGGGYQSQALHVAKLYL